MTTLKYLAPKKENVTKLLDENGRDLVSPSFHSVPRNTSDQCADGWVSLTLTEIMRDLSLAEELKHILQ